MLIVDLLAFGLAMVTATLLPILAMLLLTLIAMGAWLLRIPSELTGLPTALFILGGFAIFFLVAASWACRRLRERAGTRAPNLFGNITDPGKSLGSTSSVVGHDAVSAAHHGDAAVAAWESICGIWSRVVAGHFASRHERRSSRSTCSRRSGLFRVLALEHAWHFQHFDPTRATLPLIWYLGFYALFTIFPFHFPSEVCGKNCRRGRRGAGWTVAFLPGV